MIKSLLIILATFTLASCSAPSDPLEDSTPEVNVPMAEYQIGIGDQLYINVWQNADLSLSMLVRPDGKISVPLVGDVNAVGMPAEVLAGSISKRLNKFIRNPKVTVIVTSPISAEFFTRVRITGAVQSPQSIPYRQGMTILDLVLQAGSLTSFADGDDAILYRKTNKGTKGYPIKLSRILKQGDISTNYELRPSDILIVPESVF